MKAFYKKHNKYILPVFLIVILSFSRLIPHPWNFTPILAAGIFSGFYFKSFFLSLFVVVSAMFLSDIYLGFHNTIIFTYIALAIATGIGIYIKQLKTFEILASGLVSSVCFFIITNFGAWISLEMYEKNLSGLINSYVMAVPFFHNTLISTIVYLFVIKITFDSIFNQKKVRKKLI